MKCEMSGIRGVILASGARGPGSVISEDSYFPL